MSADPNHKHLVLVGGGHAHVHVLKSFGLKPDPAVRLTLIARDIETPYSGMLPGFIAGHYTRAQCHIDLRPLARFAGARLLHGEAVGLDLAAQRVVCRGHSDVTYDVLSLDIGATPRLESVPGALEHAIPLKPIDRLADRWERLTKDLLGRSGPTRIVTVGGGAAGVEVTLAMRHRLRGLLASQNRNPDDAAFTVVTRSEILSAHNSSARARFRRVLSERRVAVRERSPVTRVETGAVVVATGEILPFDALIWATEAGPAPWLRTTGLACDDAGFVKVSATLQTLSSPNVFAAGDIAANVDHPRAKAGVFAVRQGPPLTDNLRRAAAGRPLLPFTPQTRFLSLISTGDKAAIGSWGEWSAQGAWLWRVKDWIDRRWVSGYTDLPAVPDPAATPDSA